MKSVGQKRMMRKVLTVLVVLTVTLVSAAGRSKGATGMPNDRLAVTASVVESQLDLPVATTKVAG